VTSQENVEVGQRIARAFNDGDLETALASMHPDIEFIPMRAPVQGAHTAVMGA
jgi:hypothetical protein